MLAPGGFSKKRNQSMEVAIPVLFVVLVGILLFILRQVPEKSALLTGLGIAMTFIIGLTFTMLTPSFNENWSTNTAQDAGRYHAIYTASEVEAADREHREPRLYTGDLSTATEPLVGYTRTAATRAAYLPARRMYVLPLAADPASGRRNQTVFHRHVGRARSPMSANTSGISRTF